MYEVIIENNQTAPQLTSHNYLTVKSLSEKSIAVRSRSKGIKAETYQNERPYLVAELYAFRGEKDTSFEWLEKAYLQKDTWLTWPKADPLLENPMA